MPSLLSRFLGKKKIVDSTPLLDGEKYEAVPKTLSPTAATFGDSAQLSKSPSKAKSKERSERGPGLYIRRKRTSNPSTPDSKVIQSVPVLSLSLPEEQLDEQKAPGLGVVFESVADGLPGMDDEALGEKRLTPTETLTLIQKTAEVICERGLKTLGVMRPHWFASPRQQEVQLRLIHRFLRALSTQQSNGGATSADTSSPATFETELRYTRDPHDVAAVMRWGLRHLQLDGNTLASSDTPDWYRSFVESERSASYPPKAFDEIFAPLLPPHHAQLVRSTLDLVSSLAAHSEENGISGNKLSKVLGWWIVSSRNVRGLGWREFYAQWEIAGRQFEHLFLAYIRSQAAQSRMPKRLTELVKNYPFEKHRREDDGIYLPRSRFSTRSANALFVKINVGGSGVSAHPHPLRIVEDAFKADAENCSSNELATLWDSIRTIASRPASSRNESEAKSGEEEPTNSLNFTSVLADETIRLLSLVPTPDGPAGPTLSLFLPLPARQNRRSLSIKDVPPAHGVANGLTPGLSKDASLADIVKGSPTTSHQELDVVADWQAFSDAGFQSSSGLSLAASLWDNDTEVTQPTPKKGSMGKRSAATKSSLPRAASVDSPSPAARPATPPQPGRITHGVPQLVKLDEAFIDFWADTLLDPIAKTWPTFVVCQLKSIPTLCVSESDKPIEWLVIERSVGDPAFELKNSLASGKGVPPTPTSSVISEGGKPSRWSTSGFASRKRWSMFAQRLENSSATQVWKSPRKGAKEAGVGEMGEILQEEDEGKLNDTKANGKMPKDVQARNVDEDKKHDVASPPPAVSANGVSKSAEPAIAIREESGALVDTEFAAAAANLQRESSQAFDQAVKPAVVKGEDQSQLGRVSPKGHVSSPATLASNDFPVSAQPEALRHDASDQPILSDKFDGLSAENEAPGSAEVKPMYDDDDLALGNGGDRDKMMTSGSEEGLGTSAANRPIEETSLVVDAAASSTHNNVLADGPSLVRDGSENHAAKLTPDTAHTDTSQSGIPARGEESARVNADSPVAIGR